MIVFGCKSTHILRNKQIFCHFFAQKSNKKPFLTKKTGPASPRDASLFSHRIRKKLIEIAIYQIIGRSPSHQATSQRARANPIVLLCWARQRMTRLFRSWRHFRGSIYQGKKVVRDTKGHNTSVSSEQSGKVI